MSDTDESSLPDSVATSMREVASAQAAEDTPLFHKRSDSRGRARSARATASFSPTRTIPITTTQGKNVQIDSDIAAQVVKQYLLPMFERTTDSENLQKPLEAVENTVYGELKRTEQLSIELFNSKNELREVKQQLHDAEQFREAVKSELDNITTQYDLNLQEVKELKERQKNKVRTYQLQELSHFYRKNEYNVYKDLISSAENQREAYEEALHEEKATNDKLKNKATELDNGNRLLKMENDIMAERLRGLYAAINSVSGRKFTEEKTNGEIAEYAFSLQHLALIGQNLETTIESVIEQHQRIDTEVQEMAALKKETADENKKIRILSRDKIENLTKERDELEEQKKAISDEFYAEEKLCKDLQEQYDKLRQKAKQYRQRKNAEQEEKQCKNCNKYYIENDNYNWSCRTHASPTYGEMWWCCGKRGENALGCIASKHVPRDDEEDEMDAEEKEELERQKFAHTKCYSCKEYGHNPEDCEKDPNLRTHYELDEETVRVRQIQKNKKTTTESTGDVTGTVMSGEMLGGMMEGMDSDVESSWISEEEDEFYDFRNLATIKRQAAFRRTETKFLVDDVTSKEFERESQQAYKLKSTGGSASGEGFSNYGNDFKQMKLTEDMMYADSKYDSLYTSLEMSIEGPLSALVSPTAPIPGLLKQVMFPKEGDEEQLTNR